MLALRLRPGQVRTLANGLAGSWRRRERLLARRVALLHRFCLLILHLELSLESRELKDAVEERLALAKEMDT